MHNGAMIRGYLPEFLVAILMSLLLMVGYSMRGNGTVVRSPHPRVGVTPRFLLEVVNPRGLLRVDLDGRLTGSAGGQLNHSELADLRQAIAKLVPGSSGGAWKMRFYDSAGVHEVAFDPKAVSPEMGHVLDNLRILGYLKN